jgi:hypothetical protein
MWSGAQGGWGVEKSQGAVSSNSSGREAKCPSNLKIREEIVVTHFHKQ